MKRYLKSGYPNVQDIILEPGTYTFWAYIRSEFGDTYSFRLFNGTEWEVFDIDVEMGKWTKAFEVFTVKDKKTKLDPFARYFDSEQPVFLYKPQLIKGNIPSDAGASPFDIDSIIDDLHDNVDGIADFTNEEFADRVLSASERVSLKREMEAVESIFQSLRGSYEKLVINPYVPAIALSDLTLKYDSVMTAKTTLFNVLNLIIAGDDIVSPEEITAKDNALLTLNAALYSYNLAEKEITNALGADYTQKISAIRDFTDDEFADRMLSETEKISLSHDLDNVQTVVDSVTSRFNELLLNPFITEADRDLLVEKYNALLDAWDWDEDLDSSKPNGLKTVILNIINDPDNLIDPDEMLEKDLALSAFNLALGEFSATEVYISKIIVEYAIEQATFWSIHATAPVIYKDSRNAVTDGHHMPITVKGQLHRGTQIQDGGYITVTADEEVEATEASFSPVLISPLDHDDKSIYTIRLYDSKAKTMLLDTMTIPVVFRGASGKDAINVTLSNGIDSVPASNSGVVSSYANTGTDIRVFEGATELTYDGVGTNLGTFKVTSLGINLTVGQISTPILGILKCVIGNIANLTEDKGITQFVVSGRTLEGEAFSEVKEQTISKSKKGDTGADGDGILEVLDYYGLSLDSSILPTTWFTTVPTKGANEYLWNYERILYTDGTYDETEPRVIQGKDAKSISTVVNQYVYSSGDTSHPTSGWKSTIAELGVKPEGYFLWVRDFIIYTDGTTGTTNGYVVKDGTDGYSVGLTKGEHTYSYDKDGAIKGSLSDGAVSVDVYNGAKMLTCSSTGTGLPIVDDTYRVTAIALSPLSKLTYNVAISSNNYKLTPTGITADEVEVIFTIVARTKGINTSFTRTVRYKKIQDGADGDGITSTTIHYAKSSSGTTIPTTWSTSLPTPTKGMYLWTRTTTVYKLSPTTVAYTTSYWAEDGDDAVDIRLTATNTQAVIGTNGVTPTQIIVTGTAKNTTISGWSYSVDGGSFTTPPNGVTRAGNAVTINTAVAAWRTLAIKAVNTTDNVDSVITISIVGYGAAGEKGKVPIVKEWLNSDTHLNNDNVVDYIYYRPTRTWWKLKDAYTSRVATSSPSTTYYEQISYMSALAVKVLIAEEANLANFVFKGGKLLSIAGTVNGSPATYSGQAGFVHNIVLDGESGTMTVRDGVFRGEINALSGSIGDLSLHSGMLSSYDPSIPAVPPGDQIQLSKNVIGLMSLGTVHPYMDTETSIRKSLITVKRGPLGGPYTYTEIKPDGVYINGEKLTGGGVYTHPSTHSADMISAGTFAGIVKANNNTSYTTKQVRNMILSTGNAVSSQMANGDIWIKYE